MNINSILQQIQQIQENHLILAQTDSTHNAQIVSFMKTWYACARNQARKQQYSYVWSLHHPYPLEQLTHHPPQNTSLPVQQIGHELTSPAEQRSRIKKQWQWRSRSGSTKITFIGKNEVIIAQSSKIFLINPSLSHLEQLKDNNLPLMIILTTANIIQLLYCYIIKTSMAKAKLKVKVITVEDIYIKFNKLVNFISSLAHGQQSEEGRFNKQAFLLKMDQYFQYGSILWMARQNCWYEPSYDLIFIIDDHHSKINFLVEQFKVSETKLIYYGWKKLLITEQSYQYYIRQWPLQLRKGEEGLVYEAKNPQEQKKKSKDDWFLQFVEKELLEKLEEEQRDELFHCCQLIELIPNQTVAKVNLLFDYLYILLQGQFTVSESNSVTYAQGKANLRQIYGLSELKERKQRYLFTLQSDSHSMLFRILKNNIGFILYDFL